MWLSRAMYGSRTIMPGAIVVSQESRLNIAPNANIIFKNNSASYGGAIYVDEGGKLVIYEHSQHNGRPIILPKPHHCFRSGDKSEKLFFLINNTALFGGDVLY